MIVVERILLRRKSIFLMAACRRAVCHFLKTDQVTLAIVVEIEGITWMLFHQGLILRSDAIKGLVVRVEHVKDRLDQSKNDHEGLRASDCEIWFQCNELIYRENLFNNISKEKWEELELDRAYFGLHCIPRKYLQPIVQVGCRPDINQHQEQSTG